MSEPEGGEFQLRVRSATAADVPGVLPMVAAICAMHEALDAERYGMLPDVVGRYERWLPQRAEDPRSVFLVGEDKAGTLAGFLIASVEANIPIYRVSEFGFIHDVWVEPAFRGAGVARAMVEEAVKRFSAMGVSQVRLETAIANHGARKLFKACGFRAASTEMVWVGAGEVSTKEAKGAKGEGEGDAE